MLGLSLEERNELGGWKLPAGGVDNQACRFQSTPRPKAQKMMTNVYSRGEAGLDRELAVRRKVIKAVQKTLGNPSDWRSRIPLQRREFPSFEFLLKLLAATSEDERGLFEGSTITMKHDERELLGGPAERCQGSSVQLLRGLG